MSGIEDLQQRVAEAERRFGLIDVQQQNYSERLIALVSTVEEHLGQSVAEIGRLESEIGRQREENEQFRLMLFSLLSAIESGARDRLSETMQTMETKIAALIGDTVSDGGSSDRPEIVAAEAAEASELQPGAPVEPEVAIEPESTGESPLEMAEEADVMDQTAESVFESPAAAEMPKAAEDEVPGPEIMGPEEEFAVEATTEPDFGSALDAETAAPETAAESPEGFASAPGEGLSEIMERVAQLAQELARPGNMSDAVNRVTQLAEELAGAQGSAAEGSEASADDPPDAGAAAAAS